MVNQLVKILQAEGNEIDAESLTKRIIEHINNSAEEGDEWLALAIQEGSHTLHILSQESSIMNGALQVQPHLLDFFLLMYQIGALTANAINKNNLNLSITQPENEESDASGSKKNNIRDDQDNSSPADC